MVVRAACCSSRAKEFNYSVATDVLGRLVEVVSGQSLDEFFRNRIFEPLGMTDTAFWASEDSAAARLASAYAANPDGRDASAIPIDGSSFLTSAGGVVRRRRARPARPGTTTVSR